MEAIANLPEDATWTEKLLVKHRRLVGILTPLIFFELCWWCLAVKWNYFALFPDRYILSITMIFGATVAGKLAYSTKETRQKRSSLKLKIQNILTRFSVTFDWICDLLRR